MSALRLVGYRDAGAVGSAHRAELERTLVACLARLAELARASCDTLQIARLCAALERLDFQDSAARALASQIEGSGCRSTLRAIRSPLTKREDDVVGLIARGLTNRDIARLLVISERTADTHVQNILRKLDVASRAQVAAWFIQHQTIPDQSRAS